MLVSLLGLVLSVSSSFALDSDAFQQTLVGNILGSTASRAVEIKLCGPENRYDVPGLEERCDRYLLYNKSQSSELVILIGGLGAAPKESIGENLAATLYDNGYSVLIVPSAFHPDTIRLYSASGIPGFLPQDGTDGLNLAKLLLDKAKEKHGIGPEKVHLVGYSYGGLQAFFADRSNHQLQLLPIDKIVMINPPADMEYGIAALDGLHRADDVSNLDLVRLFFDFVLSPLNAISDILSAAELDNMILESEFDPLEAQALIATSFQQTLTEGIIASQDVQDIGVLPRENRTPTHRHFRKKEAKKFTFRRYMDEIALPYWRGAIQWTDAQIIPASNLKTYVSEVSADPRFRIMNTANDFLTNPTDVPPFRDGMGERYYLQDFGGHLGQVKTRMFKDKLLEYLR